MTIGLCNKFVLLLVQSAIILQKASKDKEIRNSKISYILQRVLVVNYVLKLIGLMMSALSMKKHIYKCITIVRD